MRGRPGLQFSATILLAGDAQGSAAVTIDLVRKPGSYSLSVRYNGDQGHVGAADLTSFVIDKEDSTATLTATGQGSNRGLRASLADADDAHNVVAGVTLAYFADGEQIGTASTDNNGVSELPLPPKYRNGHHDYTVRFSGNDYYSSSTAAFSS